MVARRLTRHGWRVLTLGLLIGALTSTGRVAVAQDATPAPGPDSDAGTLVLETVQSPADTPRVEFHVTTDAPWPVGDGFAGAAFDFTLSGPNGDQPISTSDQAPGGLTTVNVLAGDYTLTDDDSGASVDFTIAAGATTYVAAARYFVSNPEPPAVSTPVVTTPAATGGETTTLPTTGSGSSSSGAANLAGVLFILGIAGLTGIAALARARRTR